MKAKAVTRLTQIHLPSQVLGLAFGNDMFAMLITAPVHRLPVRQRTLAPLVCSTIIKEIVPAMVDNVSEVSSFKYGMDATHLHALPPTRTHTHASARAAVDVVRRRNPQAPICV
ncbi:hypothetical protein J6590_061567 [Homalodisca vitripennis]|nr:hypothetical protein J6590_061567 [Homalodisca vitripennis]